MRIPKSPPDFDATFNKIMDNRGSETLMKALSQGAVDSRGEYLHWDKLSYHEPPEGLSHEEWWMGTKFARRSAAKKTPFWDTKGNLFTYCITENMERELHWIDLHAAGAFESNLSNRDDGRDTYIVKSLIDEAINSSQLEGASTTRHVAKEMIRKGRDPLDESERMILNNYRAMQFIKDVKSERLTGKGLLEIHSILTDKTLSADKVGVFRGKSDDVVVEDREGEVLHTPPHADDLEERIKTTVQYANDDNEQSFIHPVIRAIILHFMIGYDHPFIDGNGRTARAMFYLSMAKSKYWLIEYISLSKAIKKSPVQYGRAYLRTETDEGDLTYFIINQLEMIRRAIETFQNNLESKMAETLAARKFLDTSEKYKERLNFRQLSLLKHAIRHPDHRYKIAEHKFSHGITYETSRKDLMSMAQLGLLQKATMGRLHVFIAPANIHEILQISESKLSKQSELVKAFFQFRGDDKEK